MAAALNRGMFRCGNLLRHLRPPTAIANAKCISTFTASAAASSGTATAATAAAAAAPKQFSRLVRFLDESGAEQFGDQTNERGRIVTRLLTGSPFGSYSIGKEVLPSKYLSPLGASHIPQIIGIGLNYTKHAHESKLPIPKYPVMFPKNISTLQHPYAAIEIPVTASDSGDGSGPAMVDYEVELAIVIGRAARNVSPDRALEYVLGYTVANDVTCRKWQFKTGPTTQWMRGKSFDTFTPLGPAVVNAQLIPNPNALALRTVLNGKTVQSSNTSDMIFSVAQIISFVSESTTLAPGTLILTGTPEGVGMGQTPPKYLKPGDEVSVSVERIGELRNFVV